MNLIKYPSIDNYSEKLSYEIQKRRCTGLFDILFAVTEKIHGSNFSIHSAIGDEIHYAKRNSFIGNGTFFNYERVVEKHQDSITRLINHLHDVGLQYVIIYGELCGGRYDGMPKLQVKAIQKEVQYSNDTEFVVFDIAFMQDNKLYYIDQIEIEELCNASGLNCIHHEYIGTLAGCLRYAEKEINRNSIVPEMFDMPELETNPIEGFVIKQITGGDQEADKRVVLKIKSEKFKERKPVKDKKPRENNYLDESTVAEYININRFNSATSKYGEYTIKDFGQILQLIAEDIANEAKIENSKQLKAIIAKWMKANSKELF